MLFAPLWRDSLPDVAGYSAKIHSGFCVYPGQGKEEINEYGDQKEHFGMVEQRTKRYHRDQR
jgi:hypothetical protein